MVLPLCSRKESILLHLSNLFCFMLSIRRCRGCLTKDLKPKSRVTAVLTVLRFTFKVLACLLMLTVGSSVILSLRLSRKTVVTCRMTDPLRQQRPCFPSCGGPYCQKISLYFYQVFWHAGCAAQSSHSHQRSWQFFSGVYVRLRDQ